MTAADEKKKIDFFEYLKEHGLNYTVEMVEDFLLSLKVKQFLILSGGSGTGKTKLAQLYGQYISNTETNYKKAVIKVSLGKADTNNGFTLSADNFFDKLPYDPRKADGLYKVKIGETETYCEIRMSPRLWYKPNKETIVNEILRLKSEGYTSTNLEVSIPQSSSSGDNYSIIPVGSNWTENRFILGFKNVLTDKYSSTKSLDLIIKSNKSDTEPFLLILDEMNLSHVERYFSDILSAMESGEPIVLDSDGSVPEKIDIGDNLFIIGTINVDETTYSFSSKVLDRANVIEFETVFASDYLLPKEEEDKPTGDIEFLDNCLLGSEVRSMKANDIIEKMVSSGVNDAVIKSIISDLTQLQKEMDTLNLSFGFRTIDEIFRFMYVSWIYKGKGQFDDWTRFMDSQIKQKILPKIHGNMSIHDSLVSMNKLCKDHGYQRSENKLTRMISVLEKQRYVSFNC